jgi:hypothetical protein
MCSHGPRRRSAPEPKPSVVPQSAAWAASAQSSVAQPFKLFFCFSCTCCLEPTKYFRIIFGTKPGHFCQYHPVLFPFLFCQFRFSGFSPLLPPQCGGYLLLFSSYLVMHDIVSSFESYTIAFLFVYDFSFALPFFKFPHSTGLHIFDKTS